MGCYMGGDTPSNRIRWTLFVLFFVLGCSFVITYFIKKNNCPQSYLTCIDNYYYDDKISVLDRAAARKVELKNWQYESWSDSPYVNECTEDLNVCVKSLVVYVILAVSFYIASIIPIITMLFCAQKPHNTYQMMQEMGYVPMNSAQFPLITQYPSRMQQP